MRFATGKRRLRPCPLLLGSDATKGFSFQCLIMITSLLMPLGNVRLAAVALQPTHASSSEKQSTQVTDFVEAVGASGVVQRLPGVIVDVTGKGVTLQGLDGSIRQIPCEKVIHIETNRSVIYSQSQQALKEGRINEALSLLYQARSDEPRAWVRREMTAQIVRLLHANGRYGDAAQEFLAAEFASDPSSPYWSSIPLVWFPEVSLSSEIQRAEAWMRAGAPVSELLGASFLLDGSRGAEAVAVLKRLQLVPQRDIAMMAVTQLWRREVQTADKAKIEQWERICEGLASSLRPGPCYLIATAWRAQGDIERAMLAYLKPPILWPENRRIAARCLWEVASLLAKDQTEFGGVARRLQTERLYQELATSYPESPWSRQIPKSQGTN